MGKYVDMNDLLERDMKQHIEIEMTGFDYGKLSTDDDVIEKIEQEKKYDTKTSTSKECKLCGRTYEPYKKSQKFCSFDCLSKRKTHMEYEGQFIPKHEIIYWMYRKQEPLSKIAKQVKYKSVDSVKGVLKRKYNCKF